MLLICTKELCQDLPVLFRYGINLELTSMCLCVSVQPDQVPLDENLIVSHYLHNPLVIDGRSHVFWETD